MRPLRLPYTVEKGLGFFVGLVFQTKTEVLESEFSIDWHTVHVLVLLTVQKHDISDIMFTWAIFIGHYIWT